MTYLQTPCIRGILIISVTLQLPNVLRVLIVMITLDPSFHGERRQLANGGNNFAYCFGPPMRRVTSRDRVITFGTDERPRQRSARVGELVIIPIEWLKYFVASLKY